MARPVKKTPEQWKQDILHAAQTLFLSKGYEATSVSDIMTLTGGAKGMFYRFYQSKEELMYALSKQLFLENNPFEEVRKREDLNGLEKIRTLLTLNNAEEKRNDLNLQAVSILRDPHILTAAIQENRRILTPLWLELLEEGIRDGSVKTPYARELSELLPLLNFWMLPSVFPATEEELLHKYQFVADMLSHMGLPLYDEAQISFTEKIIKDMTKKGDSPA